MKLVKYPNKILSQICEPVEKSEISSLKPIVKSMISVMRMHNGLGLAAPQVGIDKRLFVWLDENRIARVFINPVIISSSGKIKLEEGCLSIPNIRKKIKRKRIVEIDAMDKDGNIINQTLKNMDAVIVQHEIDHLNGIIILDNPKKRKSSVTRKLS